MTLLLILSGLMLCCAAAPAVLFVVNLRRYRAPGEAIGYTGTLPQVAVLVPARNEEANIAACLAAVLGSSGVELQVLVLDDASTDRTGELVDAIAAGEPRLRLVTTRSLPAGWNGKQHACWLLAEQAATPLLLFLDADVRLAPDAIARCAAELQRGNLALVSGFPKQIVVGGLERLLLPLIHFVLLGFLPLGRMRKTTNPAYAAGCGQFFLVRREPYFASGGHAAIRATRHDGLRLPQILRRAGYNTDLVDLTGLASVRMYESPGAVWTGLAKNATEGIGAPARIVPLTLLLLLGQVLPAVALLLWFAVYLSTRTVGATYDAPHAALAVTLMLLLATICGYLPRLLALRRFHQPVSSALLHPFGIVTLLGVQWYALVRQLVGRPVAWRARNYPATRNTKAS